MQTENCINSNTHWEDKGILLGIMYYILSRFKKHDLCNIYSDKYI